MLDKLKGWAASPRLYMTSATASQIHQVNSEMEQSFRRLAILALGVHPDSVLPTLKKTMEKAQELDEIVSEMRLLTRAGFGDCDSYRRLDAMARAIDGEDKEGFLIDSLFTIRGILDGGKTLLFDGVYFRWKWTPVTEEEIAAWQRNLEAENAG